MKENKKKKINKKLYFYIVKDKYIDYLYQYDSHVAYNKNETRPYVGIVFEVSHYLYFAPLFSPKEKHKKYKNNISFFRIKDVDKKQDIGIIRFTNMIPVSKVSINRINIKKYNYEYKRLLEKEYNYINIKKNKEEILFKAKKIYEIIISEKNTKERNFYKSICCNFKLLEEKCNKYMII